MKTIIGVIGASRSSDEDLRLAEALGRAIATEGWVTLNGGFKEGVMNAVSKGAHEAGGEVVGVTNQKDTQLLSEYVTIPIVTGMGNARNNINVLTGDVVVGCGALSVGTLSEVTLALSAHTPIILLGTTDALKEEVAKLAPERIVFTDAIEATIEKIKELLA